MPLPSSARALAALSCFLVLACAEQASRPASPPALVPAGGLRPLPKVEPQVLAHLGRSGPVRVIVSFRTGPGLQQDFADVRKQLDATPAENTFRQLGHRPLAAAAANYPALVILSSAPQVTKIQLDTVSRVSTSRSAKQVRVDEVWNAGRKGSGAWVAVLDTGVDTTHPFLKERVKAQACFSTVDRTRKSLCPNGQVKDTSAKAATPNDITVAAHGTHVAGTAAGANGKYDNECPIDGMAPLANILAIQVFTQSTDPGDCRGSESCEVSFQSNQIEALDYIHDNLAVMPVAAANLSFEEADEPSHETACDTDERKKPIDDLLAAGVATVIAAGNRHEAYGVSSPGCISTAITVGAVTVGDNPTFSRGSVVDLLAPGSCVLSAVPGGSYEQWAGTSMAAPHVTGVIAALRAGPNPASLPTVLRALLAGATRVKDCRTSQEKLRLDAFGALNALTAPTPPSPGEGTQPPVPSPGAPPVAMPGTRPPITGKSAPASPGPGGTPPASGSVASSPSAALNDCSILDPNVCPAACSMP
jgi:subtilisin family serine protease